MDPFGLVGGLVGAGLNYFTAQQNREAQEQANLFNAINQNNINASNQWFTGHENQLQREHAAEINARQLAWAREQSALQERMAAENIAKQEEFAKMGIRWKVDDARAAGLHPLAALGAQVSSFSPISVGSTSLEQNLPERGAVPQLEAARMTAPSLDLGSMGQDISRAISAMSTKEEENEKYENALRALQIQKGSLENTLLRNQILKDSGGGSTGAASKKQGMPGPTAGDLDGQPYRAATDKKTPSGFPVTQDETKQEPEAMSKYKRLPLWGGTWYSSPTTAPGDAWEDMYADVGSNLMAVPKFLDDLQYNFRLRQRKWIDDARSWMNKPGNPLNVR